MKRFKCFSRIVVLFLFPCLHMFQSFRSCLFPLTVPLKCLIQDETNISLATLFCSMTSSLGSYALRSMDKNYADSSFRDFQDSLILVAGKGEIGVTHSSPPPHRVIHITLQLELLFTDCFFNVFHYDLPWIVAKGKFRLLCSALFFDYSSCCCQPRGSLAGAFCVSCFLKVFHDELRREVLASSLLCAAISTSFSCCDNSRHALTSAFPC